MPNEAHMESMNESVKQLQKDKAQRDGEGRGQDARAAGRALERWTSAMSTFGTRMKRSETADTGTGGSTATTGSGSSTSTAATIDSSTDGSTVTASESGSDASMSAPTESQASGNAGFGRGLATLEGKRVTESAPAEPVAVSLGKSPGGEVVRGLAVLESRGARGAGDEQYNRPVASQPQEEFRRGLAALEGARGREDGDDQVAKDTGERSETLEKRESDDPVASEAAATDTSGYSVPAFSSEEICAPAPEDELAAGAGERLSTSMSEDRKSRMPTNDRSDAQVRTDESQPSAGRQWSEDGPPPPEQYANATITSAADEGGWPSSPSSSPHERIGLAALEAKGGLRAGDDLKGPEMTQESQSGRGLKESEDQNDIRVLEAREDAQRAAMEGPLDAVREERDQAAERLTWSSSREDEEIVAMLDPVIAARVEAEARALPLDSLRKRMESVAESELYGGNRDHEVFQRVLAYREGQSPKDWATDHLEAAIDGRASMEGLYEQGASLGALLELRAQVQDKTQVSRYQHNDKVVRSLEAQWDALRDRVVTDWRNEAESEPTESLETQRTELRNREASGAGFGSYDNSLKLEILDQVWRSRIEQEAQSMGSKELREAMQESRELASSKVEHATHDAQTRLDMYKSEWVGRARAEAQGMTTDQLSDAAVATSRAADATGSIDDRIRADTFQSELRAREEGQLATWADRLSIPQLVYETGIRARRLEISGEYPGRRQDERQMAALEDRWDSIQRESERHWNEVIATADGLVGPRREIEARHYAEYVSRGLEALTGSLPQAAVYRLSGNADLAAAVGGVFLGLGGTARARGEFSQLWSASPPKVQESGYRAPPPSRESAPPPEVPEWPPKAVARAPKSEAFATTEAGVRQTHPAAREAVAGGRPKTPEGGAGQKAQRQAVKDERAPAGKGGRPDASARKHSPDGDTQRAEAFADTERRQPTRLGTGAGTKKHSGTTQREPSKDAKGSSESGKSEGAQMRPGMSDAKTKESGGRVQREPSKEAKSGETHPAKSDEARRFTVKLEVPKPPPATELRVAPAEYRRIFREHELPSRALDPVLKGVDHVVSKIENEAARRAAKDAEYLRFAKNQRWTEAGKRFHKIAADVGKEMGARGKFPTGYEVLFEEWVKKGKGGSRLDVFIKAPNGKLVEVDWKTSVRSGLRRDTIKPGSGEMARHVEHVEAKYGKRLYAQESRSYRALVERVQRELSKEAKRGGLYKESRRDPALNVKDDRRDASAGARQRARGDVGERGGVRVSARRPDRGASPHSKAEPGASRTEGRHQQTVPGTEDTANKQQDKTVERGESQEAKGGQKSGETYGSEAFAKTRPPKAFAKKESGPHRALRGLDEAGAKKGGKTDDDKARQGGLRQDAKGDAALAKTERLQRRIGAVGEAGPRGLGKHVGRGLTKTSGDQRDPALGKTDRPEPTPRAEPARSVESGSNERRGQRHGGGERLRADPAFAKKGSSQGEASSGDSETRKHGSGLPDVSPPSSKPLPKGYDPMTKKNMLLPPDSNF